MEWFKHDVDAMQDMELRVLVSRHGAIGYAVFYRVVEMLYKEGGSPVRRSVLAEMVSGEFRLQKKNVEAVLSSAVELGLLEVSGAEMLRSGRVERECEASSKKKKARTAAANSRWKGKESRSEEEEMHLHDVCNADAMHLHDVCNADAMHMHDVCNADAMHMQCTCNADIDIEKEKDISPLSTPIGVSLPPSGEDPHKDGRKGGREAFSPPSEEDVAKYFASRCPEKDARRFATGFVGFYTANGWKVSGKAMKDWKAAVRYWESRSAPGEWRTAQVKDFPDGKGRYYDPSIDYEALGG